MKLLKDQSNWNLHAEKTYNKSFKYARKRRGRDSRKSVASPL